MVVFASARSTACSGQPLFARTACAAADDIAPSFSTSEMEAGTVVGQTRVDADPRETQPGVDHTEGLPDDMLHIIVPLLPTKSSMRTTVLSRWWYPIWRSVLLGLVVDF